MGVQKENAKMVDGLEVSILVAKQIGSEMKVSNEEDCYKGAFSIITGWYF
jgi:hypothetical protein